ncbi:DUF1028 domain-containing protein [Pseudooceanicola atlanticus]|uniref:DUF1028 domain-containing protein n=1 Tax=Pseudooceanicola atlanticus TaxID=1461694 RepID=UPI000694BBFB|nr:DUF1028 domain-containing protein [Pseudooceanicola atlanticus]
MTFSILAYDAETGRFGGGAATGSLCVGGWVLRGDLASGLSASQGTSPSTVWGEGVLAHMRKGLSAPDAVAAMTDPDPGRAYRQLAAIDPTGATAAFTGAESVPAAGHRTGPDVIVAGNMLADDSVLDAILDGFLSARGPFNQRILDALSAGDSAGSDSRGLMSAAMLVIGPDVPPLTLRVDLSDTPLDDLRALHLRATTGAYSEWTRLVPTIQTPHRAPTPADIDRLSAPADPEDDIPTPFPETE